VYKPTPLLDVLGDRHIVLDRRRPVTPQDVPDADVVIATWWETAEWVADLPAEKGRKFYLLQDYEMFENQPLERVAATYHLPLRKLTVSGYIRDQLIRRHDAQDVSVVLNAVDGTQFDAPPRRKNTNLTAGFVYTPTRRKRVDLAVEALTRAREHLPGLRALAFGTHLPDAAAGFPDWITFVAAPSQQDIPQLYAHCDLWLFTSRNEGFGLPILEAMACRTPVLATRAGAAPDLINGKNGLLLEPEEFGDAIATFAALSDPQWQAFSEAAYQTAHSYTWEDATSQLLSHLSEGSQAR
jgi:glycosyltransferase involved in cell wall biosynthesis